MAQTNNSRNAVVAAKKIHRATKRAILQTLCELLHKETRAYNGRLPYGTMRLFVDGNKSHHNWLSRDVLNSTFSRFKKSLVVHHSDQPCEIQAQPGSVDNISNLTSTSATSIDRKK